MDVDELWEAGVIGSTKDVLATGNWYRHMITSSQELAIGVKDLRGLRAKRVVAAWEQYWLRRVSNGTTLHATHDEFGSIPPTAQFHLPAAFAILSV